MNHLFFPGGTSACSSSGVSGLHLKHSAEHVLRGGSQKANLGIGMEAIEIGALRRKALINIGTVSLVVQVGGSLEARGIYQIMVQLEGENYSVHINLFCILINFKACRLIVILAYVMSVVLECSNYANDSFFYLCFTAATM